MDNKKIIYMVMISLFLLTTITFLSVASSNIIEPENNFNKKTTGEEYSIAYIDGSILGSIDVKGMQGLIGFINKDITVSGKVVDKKFTINTLSGTIPFSINEKIDLNIKTLLFSAIDMQCIPPYTESISGLAFGVTIN